MCVWFCVSRAHEYTCLYALGGCCVGIMQVRSVPQRIWRARTRAVCFNSKAEAPSETPGRRRRPCFSPAEPQSCHEGRGARGGCFCPMCSTVKTLKVPSLHAQNLRVKTSCLEVHYTTDSFTHPHTNTHTHTARAYLSNFGMERSTIRNLHLLLERMHTTIVSGVCLIMHTHLCFAQYLKCIRSHAEIRFVALLPPQGR